MVKKEVNLIGKLCPFPLMCIIREVDIMEQGQTIKFLVDDPLATKSVPEELRDYKGVSISINKKEKKWEIVVSKQKKKAPPKKNAKPSPTKKKR